MKGYRFFRSTHKWIGILFSVVLLNLALTGFLLLEKKKYEWIQPGTRQGTEGNLENLMGMQELLTGLFNQGHEGFRDLSDIDRIDFRPGSSVHKVRSKHGNLEIQVDAVTGEVLNVDRRRSDFFETLHDGSLFGDWAHGWLMPATAAATVFLSLSGFYLWLEPALRKRSRKKAPSNSESS